MPTYLKRFACLLAVVLLGACGGGGPSPATPAPIAIAAPVPAPVPAAPAPLPAPLPAGAWTAPASLLPASGNYVYTESDPNDYIGNGVSHMYTELNSLMSVTVRGSTINLRVEGAGEWSGTVTVPAALGGLRTGLFTEVTRDGFAREGDPPKGGLDWGGEGRGCNKLSGWFSIDKLTMSGNSITEVDLRFEQYCIGLSKDATRARVHWTLANANAIPAARPSAIPEGLWRPDPAALPASGSYVFLTGIPHPDGTTRERVYTRSNAALWMSSYEGLASIDIQGDQFWRGQFATMRAIKQFQVGYYPNMTDYARYNPLFGGLSWSGEGVSCGKTGWFAVDSVVYSGNEIAALDLRFECSRDGVTVHGKVHWQAGETPIILGPATPPATLWKPPASFQAPAGNYVYLTSDTGNYQARINKTLPIGELFQVSQTSTSEIIIVRSNDYWITFRGIEGMPNLTPGYYSGLKEVYVNPVRGGFGMTSNMTCSPEEAWVVVEQASYVLDELVSLDLRFEATCPSGKDTINGFVHWRKTP